MKKTDEYFMNRAMQLALRARGKTTPNPMVGAVVVRNGRIVGEGFHERAGMAHAEIIALEKARGSAKGASLYVTLEPCTHFGRTPPCVNKIIQSGIKEVVIGMIDPNPINNGKGILSLKNNNIKVRTGILEDKLKKINEAFIKHITRKLPFITVKIAQSLDGKIATRTGDSKWITSDKSRIFSHRIRRYYDGIMVGVNTVLRDNPRLNAWFSSQQPVKIVVDSQLSTPENAHIFSEQSNVILVTLPAKPGLETENRQVLSQKARVLEVRERSGQINLRDMMRKLAALEITNILVEGGGTLIGSLFDEKLVDKVLFFVSPKIIGGKDALCSVMGKGISRVDEALRLKNVSMRRIGEDFLVEAYV
jgi:diaminohydroxyphosphoribosylaminopyrimidine deaminase/5-amino-6-(5-phosphoribosylamino)uracil reductase